MALAATAGVAHVQGFRAAGQIGLWSRLDAGVAALHHFEADPGREAAVARPGN